MIFNKLTLVCIFVFLFGLISAQTEASEARVAYEEGDFEPHNNVDYAEFIDSLVSPNDSVTLQKRGYYCDRGYGLCKGDYCCPLNGTCCGAFKRCCPKGYYCITNRYRR
ncbi:unnamed protein product [Cunninghamella blakesleeana]